VTNNDTLSLQVTGMGSRSDRANRLASAEIERGASRHAGKAAAETCLPQEARVRKIYVASTSTPRKSLNLKDQQKQKEKENMRS